MAYTDTLPMNGSGPAHLIAWVNDTSGGIFGLMLAITILLISFFAINSKNSTRDSIPASLFITLIPSILLYTMGILPIAFVIGLAVALGLSGLLAWKN